MVVLQKVFLRHAQLDACLLFRIEKNKDGKFTFHYKGEGKDEGSIEAGTVMFGTGRAPNTKNIGLEVCCICKLQDALYVLGSL